MADHFKFSLAHAFYAVVPSMAQSLRAAASRAVPLYELRVLISCPWAFELELVETAPERPGFPSTVARANVRVMCDLQKVSVTRVLVRSTTGAVERFQILRGLFEGLLQEWRSAHLARTAGQLESAKMVRALYNSCKYFHTGSSREADEGQRTVSEEVLDLFLREHVRAWDARQAMRHALTDFGQR